MVRMEIQKTTTCLRVAVYVCRRDDSEDMMMCLRACVQVALLDMVED